MDTIKNLLDVDFVSFLIVCFIIMSGVISVATIIGKFSEIIGKPVKWVKKYSEDRELLIKTSEGLHQIQNSMKETQIVIQQYSENRVHDREQSFEIQKELTENITKLIESNAVRDKQIENILWSQKESLADRINQKYKHYLSINGIPEDEVDEFISLHSAYKAVGGNHHGDAKFNYCMEHLPIIPVEVKLKYNK